MLIVGASGLVGGAMMRVIPTLDRETLLFGTYRSRPARGLLPLDAMDAGALKRAITETRPDVILFPAAMPDFEWCETHEDEARTANLAPLRNVLATEVRVVAFSSDYVFDGKAGPYAEDAGRAPLSAYGRIKAELEDDTLTAGGTVIRTTGVFGVEPIAPGRNFVVRLVASLREGKTVTVPVDQVATPTYADDLAAAAYRIATRRGPGVWHVGGPEMLSRLDLAFAVAEAFELDASTVRGVRTGELGQKAPRPLTGGLRNERYRRTFGEEPVRPVRDALREMRAALSVTT